MTRGHFLRKWTVSFSPVVVAAITFVGLFVQIGLAYGAPDLALEIVDASEVRTDSNTLAISGNVSVTIVNLGTTETPASFSLLLFEDSNGNGKYDLAIDNTLGRTGVNPLVAGESLNVAVAVSGNVAFSGNVIYGFVDSDLAIEEMDEINNYSSSCLSCQVQPTPGLFNPIVKWAWTSSSVYPDYLNVMTTPGVIDLNGDKVSDIIFGATNSRGGGGVETGVLRALNGANGQELFTITDPLYRVSTTSSVAVGDIDLDNQPEIIACDNSGSKLIVFEHNGAFKWRSPTLEIINWGAPAIADLDLDGIPEIIIGRQVLNNNGSIRWTGNGGSGSVNGPLSLVADINMDGSPDIVAGNTVYTSTGQTLWTASVPDGLAAIANLDSDPYPEIALVSTGYVRLLNHDGTIKWGPITIPGGGKGGPPTIADFDNDGQMEIGVAGASRYVVFETNGTVKWQSPTQDNSSNVTGSSVFDFDGDGSAEVIYRDELKLRIYRGRDGQVLYQTPMSSCTWYEYPLVADVNNDGKAEIVAVANNNCGYGSQRGVYVIGDKTSSWVATRKLWNQHTYHITNINDDGTIPSIEKNSWETFNSYRQNVRTDGSALGAPDLTASFPRFDTSQYPQSVAITARVGNGGSNVALPFDVAFYDGEPKTGGKLLGTTRTLQNMNSGEFEDTTLIVSPALQGLHNICIAADNNGAGIGKVTECNEQNNATCVAFAPLPPQIIANVSPAPNVFGWNNSDVTVTFTCTDTGGGIVNCPSPVVVTTDGEGQVIIGTVSDLAGQSATAFVVLNIDKTSPVITSSANPAPNVYGWNNTDVTVSYVCSDSGSGINEAGSVLSDDLLLQTGLESGTCVDKAGNTTIETTTANIDKTLPTVTGTVNPLTNAAGWHNTPVTVTFVCNDNSSGIAECAPSVFRDDEGANQTVTGSATDKAGNSALTAVHVNIDTTPPVLIAAISAPPNSLGWHNSDVTVTFTCSDALSDIDFCPSPITVSTEGADQVISGTAVDKAGNTTTTSVTLNIDKSTPDATIFLDPGFLWPPNHKMVPVIVKGEAADNVSGISSVVFTVNDEYDKVEPVVKDFGLPILLEAWRNGDDMDGRHYIITGVITDKSGNVTTITSEAIVPHDMRDKAK